MAKDRIESKYVTVAPGVELHILEKGEGKPLVFIPGLTFSGEIFKNQLEYFSSEYRVIAIDPRGKVILQNRGWQRLPDSRSRCSWSD